jgi:hypothetical protein
MHTPLRQTGAIRWTASVALALSLLAALWIVSVLDDAWCLRTISQGRGCGLLPGWARDLLVFAAWASCIWAAGHALVSMIVSLRQRRLGE